MPYMCFSYPADVPQDIGNRSVARPVRDSKLCFSYQANAVQSPPDSKLCFSYQADIPLGIGNRDAGQPAPSVRRMAGGTCFRY
jgi:hypothetical protein